MVHWLTRILKTLKTKMLLEKKNSRTTPKKKTSYLICAFVVPVRVETMR